MRIARPPERVLDLDACQRPALAGDRALAANQERPPLLPPLLYPRTWHPRTAPAEIQAGVTALGTTGDGLAGAPLRSPVAAKAGG